MHRRSLLALLPAASAGLALRSKAAPLPPAAVTPAGFAISVQCWSFKEFTLWEAVGMAAAAGCHLELFPGQKIGGSLGDARLGPDLADDQIAALRAHFDHHAVKPVNFGVTPVSKHEKEARKTFEFARKLGLYGVTTESIEAIDLLETLAAEYDLKVAFHNHPKRPLYRLWDPDYVFGAVKDRHPNLGLCADLGHWASSGLDPLEVIRKVAPRVRAFHMKDRASIERWTHDRPFGTGVIGLAAILDEVRRHGFAGNVSIEYEHNWKTNQAEIAQCAGFLRGYAQCRA